MKRNYGIDLLRMLLMLMIVVLHVINHGGIMTAAPKLSVNYSIAILLQSFTYCAVNCYALISGYVHISSKYRISSLLQIWLQALIYSAGIALCACVLQPGIVTVRELLYFFFPVSNAPYWYLSAYVGLFVLIPFLNAGICALSEQQAKKYLCLLFFVFSVLPTIARMDTFFVNGGYSTFWLAYLYVIGACIKKFDWGNTITSGKAFLLYLICVFFSWGAIFGCESITNLLFGSPKAGFDLNAYTSPTMIAAAVALFFAFKNAAIPAKMIGFISTFSPAAFGVYLIHEHRFFREPFMVNRFAFLGRCSAPVMVAGVLAAAILVFSVCLLTDWMRCKIFAWIHVKERLEKLEEKYIRKFIAVK